MLILINSQVVFKFLIIHQNLVSKLRYPFTEGFYPPIKFFLIHFCINLNKFSKNYENSLVKCVKWLDSGLGS